MDEFLGSFRETAKYKMPKGGWLREMREALGISMQDLAVKLGVIKQRIDRIEKDEVTKKVTLETMNRVAESLNCEFVYFLVPKKPLERILEDAALEKAKELVQEVNVNMRLERQGTTEKAQKEMIADLAKDLLLKQDRRIWRKK